ncbi:MAG: rRNA maturation RNase YbeY [Bryobacterales bacterium]|nr:rRNA maturation RNase YbeY [Bryobacterales bacterium]
MEPGPTIIFRRTPAGLRRDEVRDFARKLSAQTADGKPFCCLLTSDAHLRRLNRQFRGKDVSTDVLSFPLSGGSLGDVAVSIQTAARQAAEFGHDLETEIEILMLHGVLHLLGHDHESDRGAMRRTETRWRRHFGLPAGLIERTGRQC